MSDYELVCGTQVNSFNEKVTVLSKKGYEMKEFKIVPPIPGLNRGWSFLAMMVKE